MYTTISHMSSSKRYRTTFSFSIRPSTKILSVVRNCGDIVAGCIEYLPFGLAMKIGHILTVGIAFQFEAVLRWDLVLPLGKDIASNNNGEKSDYIESLSNDTLQATVTHRK